MLKTTLIAHASMLIQSNKTTILTDPVWFDYLWEEINVLCPSIDLDLEKISHKDLKESIQYCEGINDYGSRDVMMSLLIDTEEHIDFLETQIDLISKIGIQNYMQSQIADLSE
jgi:hypothetical protein